MTVYAIGARRNNAELVRDCAELGYLRTEWTTLDATYGLGRFWKLWRPSNLTTSDLHTPADVAWDFTAIPAPDCHFDAVVFDPPYKLNGTSTGRGAASCDESYGVHRSDTWQGRHELINAGIRECARVAKRVLLVKCQDQVCSGKKRWQTREFADTAESCGFRLVDMLHVQGSRPQPAGRRQVHAQADYSTLLVLARGVL